MDLRLTCVLLLGSWALAGCGCDPPGFYGEASETLVENLRDALDEFYRGVPEGAVCIPRVEFHDLPGRDQGGYDPEARNIAIEVEPGRADDDPYYRVVITHEACHAARSQMEISLGAEIWQSDDWRVQANVAEETFAYICQAGPKTIQLFAPSCEEDTAGMEAYDLLRAELYTRAISGVGQANLRWLPVSSAPFPGAASKGIAVTGTVGDAIRVALRDGSLIQYLSVWTGAAASPAPALVPPDEAPEIQGATVTAWATWADVTLLAAEVELINGGAARRLIYEDSGGIASLGCPRLQETVFAQGDRLWSAYAEGDEVAWGYWQ